MAANDRQVGGTHYKNGGEAEEHWDRVDRLGLDYFQACITKYVERWKLKGGIQDLEKARHYLDKYIELADRYLPAVKKGSEVEVKTEAVRPFPVHVTTRRCTICNDPNCQDPGGKH
jgi:hypothetical protein